MHQARRLRPIQPGEIADICSKSRAIVFEWIKAFRQGGFEALLLRGKPGPQGGELRGVPEKVARQLREGIQSGRWPTAQAARQWLAREHGVHKPYGTVWQWIKKLGGVPRPPRSRHRSGARRAASWTTSTGRSMG